MDWSDWFKTVGYGTWIKMAHWKFMSFLSFPSKNMVMFNSYVNVYQSVTLGLNFLWCPCFDVFPKPNGCPLKVRRSPWRLQGFEEGKLLLDQLLAIELRRRCSSQGFPGPKRYPLLNSQSHVKWPRINIFFFKKSGYCVVLARDFGIPGESNHDSTLTIDTVDWPL